MHSLGILLACHRAVGGGLDSVQAAEGDPGSGGFAEVKQVRYFD